MRNLHPDSEVAGLLALMLLQHSRRAARIDDHGELRLLDEQDRALWDKEAIQEGCALADDALSRPPVGA